MGGDGGDLGEFRSDQRSTDQRSSVSFRDDVVHQL